MALSQEQIAKCRAWATAPSRHWQILNRAKWKYQFRGSAIVRYVEEVKMDEDMVRDMLAYLTSDDCLQDLETYNQGLTPENAYKPTKAWYEIGNKAAGGVRSVRLYHALTADPEENADGPYLVEDGCAYKVSLEYHWNETSVPDVQKSTSGVSYRITNISHDQETDRYSYVIETRERVQQDIAEYLMSQTVYSKDSEEVHLGVKQDNVASTGQQVSVGGGRIVKRKLSKNGDCTSDIHNSVEEELPVSDAVVKVDKTLEGIIRTTKNKSQAEPAPFTPDKPGSSVTNEKTPGGLYDQTIVEVDETPLGVKGEGCGKTIFEHSHSTTENVPDRPTIDAPTASGGVVEKQSASMTRYGTWDVHKTVETELPVANASVSASKSLRAVRKAHTDRNQSEPLPMDGLEVGESRRSNKTPGGLYDNTVEQVDKTDVGNIGSDCAKTIFSHSDTAHENVAERPEGEAEDAGGGIVSRKSIRETEFGTFDVTTTTEREISVQSSSESVSVSLTGKTVVTENRNMADKAEADNLGIGESVTNSMTPGGRYNQTIRRIDRTLDMKVGESCDKTVFEHRHETDRIQGSDPGFSHVDDAGDGTVRSKSVSVTADGSYRVSERETTETASDYRTSTHVGLTGTVKTTVKRNQSAKEPEDGLDVGESVENVMTPGGRWNTTKRELQPGAKQDLGKSCTKTAFEHRHSKSTVQSEEPGFEHVEEAADGKVLRKSVSRTSDGAYRVDEDETQEKFVAKSSRTVRMTLSGLQIREESRNQEEPPDEGNLDVGDAVHYTKTPGGLYNVSKETAPKEGAGLISERCHQDNFTHHHTQVENKGKDADDVAEHSFEDGVIVDKAVSVQSNGTKDVTTSTTTPKPWIQRYGWESGDSRHYVVKYGNQQNEFADVIVPTDADSVQKNDHINAFNLHDGQIVWAYGPWRSMAGDLKFIKYGKQQKFYRSWVKPHERRRYHVEHTIQMVFIRGDAYTDYLSDFIEADANRTQVGVLAVKLLDKYKDKDGNLLAEWVRLQGSVGAAKVCTSDCKHGNIDDNAAEAAIARILSAFEGMSAAQTSSNYTASALVGIEDAIVASGNFGSTYAFNKEDGWSHGLGFETAIARKK